MRQHQGDAIHAAPFHLSRSNELVNHHLGTVGKVAKLGFPNHQGVGVVGRVSVLKAQYGLFRKDGVNHQKRRLVVGHMLERRVSANVPLLAVLVVDNRVPVGKSATATVFARQTHGVTTGHQRGKGHVLAHTPIHWNITAAHGSSVVVDLFHQLVRRDVGWNGGDALRQTLPLG